MWPLRLALRSGGNLQRANPRKGLFMGEMAYGRDRGRGWGWFGDLDWGAIVASVVAGMGITILLVTLGAAAGIEAADDEGGDNAGRIAAGVGTWAVLSAMLGTLAGTFIGGRFSRTQSPGSATYHGLTSWALGTLITVWLGATGALGLLGSALARDGGGGAAGGGGVDLVEQGDGVDGLINCVSGPLA